MTARSGDDKAAIRRRAQRRGKVIAATGFS